MTSPAPASRIDLVDALRGFAMAGICLLHFVEHFDMGGRPPFPPAWLAPFDFWANEAAFFAFAGKSYSLFALMFGLSFLIQADKAVERGKPHDLSFAWRMLLLFVLGYVHSLLFVGDFLGPIALLGFSMLAFRRLPTRLLLVVSALLLLIPSNLVEVLRAVLTPGSPALNYAPGRFYKDVIPALQFGELGDMLRVNFWLGHKAKWNWTIENGRYLQMLGLFALGLALGRLRLFSQPAKLARVALITLVLGLLLLPPLYLVKMNLLKTLELDKSTLRAATGLVAMYINVLQMLAGTALLALLFRTDLGRRALGLLQPYGRMSLSCYVSQSFVGVPLFYNFGFGMYRHLGSFLSLLAGLIFLAGHLALAHLWLRHFNQGPLEWLWRCLTDLDFSRPLRRRNAAGAGAPVREIAAVQDATLNEEAGAARN